MIISTGKNLRADRYLNNIEKRNRPKVFHWRFNPTPRTNPKIAVGNIDWVKLETHAVIHQLLL